MSAQGTRHMIFSTPAFLFLFLPPVLLIGLFLRSKAQNVFLLLASLLFYAWGEGGFVLLLLAAALFNHGAGLIIGKTRSPGRKKILLVAALACNLAPLLVFKYAHFIAANLGVAAGGAAAWHLPLGISFFTFMAIAYLVEVYNGSIPAEKNFLHTALFISFFPTVLAGPINRYSRLGQQLAERETTPEDLAAGIGRFIIGLGKKVLLADALAGSRRPRYSPSPMPASRPALAWLGALCFLLQIFLDFSGYCDMAIGLGRMFGFRFMENFNYPYIARSITEFWSRWHISLSTWLRDFMFLPLAYAVSRRLKARPLAGHPQRILVLLPGHVRHHAPVRPLARRRLDLHRLGGLSRPVHHAGAAGAEKNSCSASGRRCRSPTPCWPSASAGCCSAPATSPRPALSGDPCSGPPRRRPGVPAALYLDRRLVFFLAIGALVALPVFPALRAGFARWAEPGSAARLAAGRRPAAGRGFPGRRAAGQRHGDGRRHLQPLHLFQVLTWRRTQ